MNSVKELENERFNLEARLTEIKNELQRLFEKYCEEVYGIKIGSIVKAYGRNLIVKKLYKINMTDFSKPNILGVGNMGFEELITADHWELSEYND